MCVQGDRRSIPPHPLALGKGATQDAEVSADVASPSARGLRHKVPLLNLTSGSLRMSAEAITPPCSFPLRGQVCADFELLNRNTSPLATLQCDCSDT